MTTNDENLIRNLRALGEETPDDSAVERDLAEFHAAYAALEDDPAAVSQLDVLFADAAFGAPEVITDDDGTPSAVSAPHGPMVRWVARPHNRLIGVLVPHPMALNRLLDVLPLVEADHRVQVVFITPPSSFQWAGMEEPVRELGGVCVPWQQALLMRFDLILAASHWGIQDVTGPVLLVSHGLAADRPRNDPWTEQVPRSLDRGALMVEEEVVPAAMALAHEGELAELAEVCPPAVPRAVVVGDLSFDRMLASRPYRQRYRDALGVRDGQRLVVVSSTWGPHSLFGADPGFFARLAAELPAEEYRVVGVLHPFMWHGHGRRQVLAWLGEARAAGLDLVSPEEDRAAVVGADVVVGDHGSVSLYAAGLDVPVLMHLNPLADARPGSAVASLTQRAPSLHLDRPLFPQVERAIGDHVAQRFGPVAGLITSNPGQAGGSLRQVVYSLLNLSEPAYTAPISPVSMPKLLAA